MLSPNSNRAVRVLQLVPTLQRRGIEKVVCGIALELHGHGYEIDVCCQRAKGPLEAALRDSGVRVYCLGEKGVRDPLAAWRLLGILRSGQYDVLHLHCPVEAGYQLPIAWLARVPRLICTFHSTPGLPSPPAMHVKAWMRRRFATFMSHRVDWVYACSAAVLESQQQSGWHSRNSSVIYNGIDLTQLCLRADNPGAKAALGFSVGAQVIGSVGSLCEQKGQSHLIRCLPLIRRRIPDACLLLVGSGPDGPNLAELARELGCGEAVRFVGERDDVVACIHAMDVFAFPSIAEGFGLALVEAMACGVCVVASAVGGIPEVVADGVSGLLVPPGDHAALAAAILRLLTDCELAQRVSANAIRVVSDSFGREKMASQVSDLYQRLLKDRLATRAVPPDVAG
jgi:glycosyltransferase involved in cell wall biosynthesis